MHHKRDAQIESVLAIIKQFRTVHKRAWTSGGLYYCPEKQWREHGSISSRVSNQHDLSESQQSASSQSTLTPVQKSPTASEIKKLSLGEGSPEQYLPEH